MSKVWLCHPHAQYIQKGDSIFSCGCVKREDKLVLIASDIDYPNAPCRHHAPAIFEYMKKKGELEE